MKAATLTPAESAYIGKAKTPEELLRRLAVITDQTAPRAAPVAFDPFAEVVHPEPREANPENPAGALFVGAWAMWGSKLCRVVGREPGFRIRDWPLWVLRHADGDVRVTASFCHALPDSDPRVLAAVALLTTTEGEK